MRTVRIHEIEPGMILEKEIITSRNMMLLPAGTELNESHLKIMKTWGIIEIQIESDDNATATFENLEPSIIKNVTEDLNDIFKFNNMAKELVSEIYRISLRHRLEQAAKNHSAS